MNDNNLTQLAEEIQIVRRHRNNQLEQAIRGEIEIYNLEDLMRLVGELNAAYNHATAAIAAENEQTKKKGTFCLLKHLSTAIVLAGEVDGNVKSIYGLMERLTNNKIRACSACGDDSNKDMALQGHSRRSNARKDEKGTHTHLSQKNANLTFSEPLTGYVPSMPSLDEIV